MKELLDYMVKELVDNPNDVEITEEPEGEKTVIFKLKVDETDLGKVIGKKGRTAQAMRTILSCASAKEKKRAILEIVD